MASRRHHRIASGALALALLGCGLAACGGGDGDISKATFLRSFSEQSPLNPELDQCIVDEIFENLDQEQINSFWGEADTPLSAENTKALEEASTTCAPKAVEDLDPELGSTEPATTQAGGSTTQPATTQAG